jgi:hypothetical protein
MILSAMKKNLGFRSAKERFSSETKTSPVGSGSIPTRGESSISTICSFSTRIDRFSRRIETFRYENRQATTEK